MATRNFNVKNGLTAGNITLDATTNTTTTANLVATGNVTFNGPNVSLGSVSNLKITGGTGGYVLSTDGAGNLSWAAQSTQIAGAYVFTQSTPATTWVVNHNLGVQYVNVQVIDATGNSYTGRYNYPTITFNNAAALTITFDSAVAGYAAVTSGGGQQNVGGANTQIQFNDANVLGGSAAFTFNKTSNLVSMGGALSVTGNANVGNLSVGSGTGGSLIGANLVSANFITGTLTTAAQPNITSVGTLTSLAVTGNITGGNLLGPLANGNSNVRIATSNGNVTISAVGNTTMTITGTGANVTGTANISGNANIGNIGTAQVLATANVTAPQFISNVATGTAPLTVASNTLVSNLNADLLDGFNTATANTANTVAVRDANGNVSANFFIGNGSQLTGIITSVSNVSNGNSNLNIPAANGNINISVAGNANLVVFTGTGVNVAGTLNATGNANVGNIGAATAVITTGNITTVNGNVANASTIIANASNGTVFANNHTASGAASGNINALTITGNLGIRALAATYTDNVAAAGTIDNAAIHAIGTPTVAASNAITTSNLSTFYIKGAPAAGTNVTITNGYALHVASGNSLFVGNVTVGNIIGNGQALTGLAGANVTGQVGNALVAGTVYTATQPNITSVGTLTGLTVGNATANAVFGNGTITLNNGLITGNGNGLSSLQASNVTGTLPNAVTNNITNVGTITSGTWNSTFTAGLNANTLANIQGGNVSGAVASATAATNASALLQNTSSATTVYPTFTTSSANGNSSAVINTGISANLANASITATTFVGALSGAATSATTAGTVTTAAQPNITSVSANGASFTMGTTANGGAYWSSGSLVVNAGNGSSEGGQLTLAWANVNNLTGQANSTWNLDVDNSNVFRLFYQNATGGTGVVLSANASTNVISAIGNISAPIFIGSGNNLSNIQGGNVIGAVASATAATNASALLQNTSTATTVYPTFTTSSANGNSSAVINTGISANLGNASITATTFVGALSGAATTAGTVTTNAQPNITSVGTLSSLAVTGNVTAGNVYANAGTIGASLLTGTLTTAAQPNITSVGTLTSASVTGNVTAGNLYANSGAVGANTLTIANTASIGGNLAMNSKNITGLADPVNPQDAATKNYVDTALQGLHVHDSCNAATTNTLATLTGGTIAYNNGSSGVGANLTLSGTPTLGFLSANTFDGNFTAVATNRIMVKNEANAVWNGIYTVTSNTVLTRATDFDTTAEAAGGDFFFVTSGTTNGDTGWVQTTDNPVIGTSNIVFQQFSGAGTYTAGTGLTLTGTVFSITNTAVTAGSYGNGDRVATFTVNGQGQLTAASNVAITANAANLTGTTLNSTIVTSSLTSVGTLGSLAVTGNATAGNFVGNFANGNSAISIPAANGNINLNAAGNATPELVVTATGINVAGTLNATGNANVGNIGAAAGVFTTVAGSLTTASQPNVTSLGTLSSLAITSGAATKLTVTANAVPTADMVTITNAGQGVTTAGVNGISLTYVGGAAAVEASAYRTDFTPGGTTGGTWNGFRFVAASNAASGVTMNAIKIDNITGGAGTENMIFAGTGWDNVLNYNGTSVIFGNGQVNAAQVIGTLPTSVSNAITNVGTITSGTWNSTFTAGLNANTLANIQGANVSGAVASATAATNASALLQNTSTATTVYPTFSTSSANGNSSAVINTGISANLGNASITATTFVGALSGAATSATTAGTVTTNAQPNITSVGTLTGLTIGNATANAVFGNGTITLNSGLITGNGNGLSSLQAANITGTLPNAVTNNITNVGTITSGTWNSTFTAGLNANTLANIQGGNISGAVASATSATNASALLQNTSTATTVYPTFTTSSANGNSSAVINTGISANLANASITATTFVGALSGAATSATTAGTVTTAAQPNITSVGTLTSLAVSGNSNAATFRSSTITANTVTSVLTYGADNLFQFSTQNGSATNASGQEVARAGINYSGTGWDSFTQYVRGGSSQNGWQILYAGNTAIANISNTGVAVTGLLSATGNVSFTGANVSLGSNANVKITGGSSGQILSTDGAGNLSWVASQIGGAFVFTQATPATTWTINHNLGVRYVNIEVIDSTGNSYTGRYNYPAITFSNTTHCVVTFDSAQAGFAAVTSGGGQQGPQGPAASPGGANTNVQFNDAGTANGSANFTFDKTTNLLTVTGNVTTTGQLRSTVATGTAPLTVNSTTQVANLYATRANIADLSTISTVTTGNYYVSFVSGLTGNLAEGANSVYIANIANGSLAATTFVGALSGAATSATTAGTVTTAAQPNITSVGTLTSLGVNGTVTAVAFTANTGVFTGNANGLSSIQGANVVGTVASATAATNASALLQNTSTATTVYPTFTTSSANGNSQAVFNTGISANLGNASITATTFVGALSGAATSATTAGTVTTNAQPNITSVGTLSSLAVTANATANNFVASTFNLNTSNSVTIPAGTVVTYASQQGGRTYVGYDMNTYPQLYESRFVNFSTSTNVPSGAGGTGYWFGMGAGDVANRGFDLLGTSANTLFFRAHDNGNTAWVQLVSNVSGTAVSATTAGTVTTAAQPNITSVGTLTGLTVSGSANLASSSGNVGIGTTSPATKLHVSAASGYNEIRVSSGSNNLGLAIDGSAAYLAAFQSMPLVFQTNSTERARITNVGYLEAVYSDRVVALGNTGTAINIDLSQGTVFTATLTGNCTFTLTNPNSNASRGSSFTLILTNDGTAGRTVAWAGGSFRFPGGASAISRTTAANAVDIWVFFTPDGGTTWYGNISMKDVKA